MELRRADTHVVARLDQHRIVMSARELFTRFDTDQR
jgi:hypothetical protein